MSRWRDRSLRDARTLTPGTRVRLAGRVTAVESVLDPRVPGGAASRGSLTQDGAAFDFVAAPDADLRRGDLAVLEGDIGADGAARIIVVDHAQVVARPARDPSLDTEFARLAGSALRARLAEAERVRDATRAFFRARGFLEVDAGVLVDEPGQEPHLEPPRLAHAQRWLATSPELRMKRLLVAGHERIVSIGPAFRGGVGERSDRHHPEFLLAEWYRAWEDEYALIDDLEALFPAIATAVSGRPEFRLPAGPAGAGRTIRVDVPFDRLTLREAFARHAGVDLEPFLDGDAAAFRAEARRAGVPAVKDQEDPEILFFRVHLDRVEPRLGVERPVILHGWPASMAALAALDASDPRLARRFECFALGLELANAFFELCDPELQRARFEAERELRARAGGPPLPAPARFLAALELGLPPSAGIALGLERVHMLAGGVARIGDLRAFPEPPDAVL